MNTADVAVQSESPLNYPDDLSDEVCKDQEYEASTVPAEQAVPFHPQPLRAVQAGPLPHHPHPAAVRAVSRHNQHHAAHAGLPHHPQHLLHRAIGIPQLDGFMPDIDLGRLSTEAERKKEREKDLENIQQMIQASLGF